MAEWRRFAFCFDRSAAREGNKKRGVLLSLLILYSKFIMTVIFFETRCVWDKNSRLGTEQGRAALGKWSKFDFFCSFAALTYTDTPPKRPLWTSQRHARDTREEKRHNVAAVPFPFPCHHQRPAPTHIHYLPFSFAFCAIFKPNPCVSRYTLLLLCCRMPATVLAFSNSLRST